MRYAISDLLDADILNRGRSERRVGETAESAHFLNMERQRNETIPPNKFLCDRRKTKCGLVLM